MYICLWEEDSVWIYESKWSGKTFEITASCVWEKHIFVKKRAKNKSTKERDKDNFLFIAIANYSFSPAIMCGPLKLWFSECGLRVEKFDSLL